MRKWQNCNFPFSAECGGTPAGGESAVHKLMDAMSSAQKLRGAGLTPHFHAERSSNGSCGSPSPVAELTQQVEKSTPAAYEPCERRPISPARGTWQLAVRCLQLSTRVSLAIHRMVCAGANLFHLKCILRCSHLPSSRVGWPRAWTAWNLSASGLKWIPSCFPFVCVVFFQVLAQLQLLR